MVGDHIPNLHGCDLCCCVYVHKILSRSQWQVSSQSADLYHRHFPGPIVWNAAILLTLFLVSLFLGPMLDPRFPKFRSTIAFIAHFLGVVGMLGFFEFLVSLRYHFFYFDSFLFPSSGFWRLGVLHMLFSG